MTGLSSGFTPSSDQIVWRDVRFPQLDWGKRSFRRESVAGTHTPRQSAVPHEQHHWNHSSLSSRVSQTRHHRPLSPKNCAGRWRICRPATPSSRSFSPPYARSWRRWRGSLCAGNSPGKRSRRNARAELARRATRLEDERSEVASQWERVQVQAEQNRSDSGGRRRKRTACKFKEMLEEAERERAALQNALEVSQSQATQLAEVVGELSSGSIRIDRSAAGVEGTSEANRRGGRQQRGLSRGFPIGGEGTPVGARAWRNWTRNGQC